MNLNNLAALCAIFGFIAVIIKLLFFSGGKVSHMDDSIEQFRKDICKLELDSDRKDAKIAELLIIVGRLEGEVRRINGKGH